MGISSLSVQLRRFSGLGRVSPQDFLRIGRKKRGTRVAGVCSQGLLVLLSSHPLSVGVCVRVRVRVPVRACVGGPLRL